MWLSIGWRGERRRKQHAVCRSNLLRSISHHAGARVCIADWIQGVSEIFDILRRIFTACAFFKFDFLIRFVYYEKC